MLLNNIDQLISEMFIDPNDPMQARRLAVNPTLRKYAVRSDERLQYRITKDPVALRLQQKLAQRQQQITSRDAQLRMLQKRSTMY